MRSAMRAMDAQAPRDGNRRGRGSSKETPPATLGQRSRLGRTLAEGKFITLVEIVPPHGIDCSREIEGAMLLARLGVDAVDV